MLQNTCDKGNVKCRDWNPPPTNQFISLYIGTPLDQQDFNMMSHHA